MTFDDVLVTALVEVLEIVPDAVVVVVEVGEYHDSLNALGGQLTDALGNSIRSTDNRECMLHI